MAEKLSRTKKYQELRNRLDEETTAAQEDKINQHSGFARLSRSQSRSLSHANSTHIQDKKGSHHDSANSAVMQDLLGEVKRYNIDQGNRVTDDTQINILASLDATSSHRTARNSHFVEMEGPVEQDDTIEEKRIVTQDEVDGVVTYMPNQKLTRINPIRPVKNEKPQDNTLDEQIEPIQEPAPKSTVVLGSDDIVVDDRVDTDHLSMFDTAKTTDFRTEETPVQPVSKKHKKRKKASKPSSEMPSAKIRMSTRDIDDMETQPKSKSSVIINVILIVLIILLIASLAATFYFIWQMGV